MLSTTESCHVTLRSRYINVLLWYIIIILSSQETDGILYIDALFDTKRGNDVLSSKEMPFLEPGLWEYSA